jgi:ADP-ribose pyrophosphatase YjhB (NUDIX family)
MVLKNYYETLPRKRMASSAIFLDPTGQILIVKPTYRSYWLLPGGSVEENESPREACIREVKEELGIDTTSMKLLGIDYLSKENEETECIQFAFYGGILSTSPMYTITLPAMELSDYRFLPLEEVLPILSPKLARGLPYYLDAHQGDTVVYLEDGRKTC